MGRKNVKWVLAVQVTHDPEDASWSWRAGPAEWVYRDIGGEVVLVGGALGVLVVNMPCLKTAVAFSMGAAWQSDRTTGKQPELVM